MILDTIVADKRIELEKSKQAVPLSTLEERAKGRQPRSFKAALSGKGIHLIAEVKRASPSRGLLCPNFDPVEIAMSYERGGASAISVLTETKHFQGSLDYLDAIRRSVSLPLLRKDFIFDPYQVYEAAANGADALLLIVAVLDPVQLRELLTLSKSLGMDCLVETHQQSEMEIALMSGADIVGINNRDLTTFKVSLRTTRYLRPMVPPGIIVVSESGIKTHDDVARLSRIGVNGILVGEALVTAVDIPERIRGLLHGPD